MAKEILNMELSEEDEALLRESLSTWKEEVYATLMEEVDELKSQKIEELEEANREYQAEVKEEFAQKMVDALDEMRSEIRAEVLSEMIESNPELQILERIKEIVAPTLNEDYFGNIYAEEIQTLREENEALQEAMQLEEGAETLANLIAPYSEKTQNIILAMIKEGNSEEVTEQFYELIESLKEVEDDEDLDEDDEDDTVADDEDFDDEDSDDEDDDDEEEEDEDDEDVDEDFENDDPYINEDETGEDDEIPVKKINSLLSEIAGLTK
jgi:exonuclease VII large subunit